jgi:ABC-type phosphate/phosphonate transport system permease subunit
MEKEPPKSILIAEKEDDIGDAKELAPKDKARFTLAGWILAALMVLTIFAAMLLVFVPTDRQQDAREFFAFVKAFVPPLITLVIGFYFNAQGD